MTKDEFIEKWTIMYQGENGEDEETHERIKQLMLSDLEALSQHDVMPRLVCHYNEREAGYLTVGKEYQAISINEDGWEIKDDSGSYNTYSCAYLNEV
jgi:hypothetical protein